MEDSILLHWCRIFVNKLAHMHSPAELNGAVYTLRNTARPWHTYMFLRKTYGIHYFFSAEEYAFILDVCCGRHVLEIECGMGWLKTCMYLFDDENKLASFTLTDSHWQLQRRVRHMDPVVACSRFSNADVLVISNPLPGATWCLEAVRVFEGSTVIFCGDALSSGTRPFHEFLGHFFHCIPFGNAPGHSTNTFFFKRRDPLEFSEW